MVGVGSDRDLYQNVGEQGAKRANMTSMECEVRSA